MRKGDSPRSIRRIMTKFRKPSGRSDDSPRNRRSTPSFVRDWGGCCLLAILILVFVSHQYLQTESRLPGEEEFLHRHHTPIHRAENRTNVEGVGFVLLGLGPYARQLKCEAAVESLRTHGGWDGAIYLFTDAPKCFVEGDEWKTCGIDAVVVDVNDDLSSGFTMPSFYKTRGNRLRSKKYKTRIFELIKDPAIDVLIYMDCDMLVAGAEHGMGEFVREYVDRFDAETQFLVYPENNPTKINGVVHTGMFIAHRQFSQPVLQRWAEQLDTEIDASDQAAFVRAGITEYAFIDELKYLYRPRCDRDDCLTFAPLLFNHINGARCWNQGKEEIQSFVDRWELCTYKTHNYCFPWYMTQFAMSWFPYTSCRKMEEERSISK